GRSERRRRLSSLLRSTAIAVLYVGRSKRTITPAQRRALEARDRHCIFPGCRAHPRRCHAHHVREWENGGSTDLDNLALLCVRHHISVHEGGWTLTPTPGIAANETGYWTLHPPPRPQP
ncbi:MAG: HNH endonuclease, partial [Candidatus Nanopelagicales bacterium]